MTKKLTKAEFELLTEEGYSEKVIDLYRNQVNVSVIKEPDVDFTHTGSCGDTMQLYLKISDRGFVEDAKFQYLGCPGAASSGSAITTIVKGKTREEAKRITEHDVLDELGGLPESKRHCLKLVVTTLQKAIIRYDGLKRRRLSS